MYSIDAAGEKQVIVELSTVYVGKILLIMKILPGAGRRWTWWRHGCPRRFYLEQDFDELDGIMLVLLNGQLKDSLVANLGGYSPCYSICYNKPSN